MKFQDLLLPLGLGLLTTTAIQYFFFSSKDVSADEVQTFVAPTTRQESKPLQLEVDFLDGQQHTSPESCTVDTPWGHMVFSTDGASLQELTFKRNIDGKEQELQTIAPVFERENTPFLVALPEKTPYFYELIACAKADNGTSVVFQAKTDSAVISKTFFVHNETHTIDLNLSIEPKSDSISARVFVPSPELKGLADDIISSVVVTKKDNFEKVARKSVPEQQGWLSPYIFGSDNRYFVHAMVKDFDSFAQRAYYKFSGKNELISVLESQEIKALTTWKISFYCGPKDLYDLTAVDSRLEKTLEYSGIFSAISKFLLKVLRWLYSYLHNYGYAIIALTVLVKLLLLPVTMNSERSMKDRLEFQKKLNYLRQRYKNDPETLQREQAELLKTQGFGGLGGCLPMLMQIPLFFGLSRLLSGSIELYQAPMAWIPDLAARDPYYILPIIVCVALLIQSSVGDAAMDAKQRLTGMAMAFFLGAITVNLSAGLALYICVNTVLSVLQTKLLKYFRK